MEILSNSCNRYSRVLIKISGEALQDKHSAISDKVLTYLVSEIASIQSIGIQTAIVVGGGNIIRGELFSEKIGIDRVNGDYMGMLATVINGMALHAALIKAGLQARLQTALILEQVAAPYIREKAIRHLESGKIMVFAAGTGNPFFTTDTAAALRAAEIGANALFKATKVDGVYSADPKKNNRVKQYRELSFDQAINKKLKVLDATAMTLCRDRQLPLHVFKLLKKGTLLKIITGGKEGSVLHP